MNAGYKNCDELPHFLGALQSVTTREPGGRVQPDAEMHSLYVSLSFNTNLGNDPLPSFFPSRLISRVFTPALIGSILGVAPLPLPPPLSPSHSHFEIGGQLLESGSSRYDVCVYKFGPYSLRISYNSAQGGINVGVRGREGESRTISSVVCI